MYIVVAIIHVLFIHKDKQTDRQIEIAKRNYSERKYFNPKTAPSSIYIRRSNTPNFSPFIEKHTGNIKELYLRIAESGGYAGNELGDGDAGGTVHVEGVLQK